jgi:Zn-dependent protease
MPFGESEEEMVGSGVRIARTFGIDIRVDWSWLLIFVLVAWNLASVFTNAHSGWGAALSWGLALSASILFSASVLLHELAHSLVAKAGGMRVRSIKLFLFGGVSNIEREPPSAGAEFLMPLVGPLTSIVLGVALVIAGGFAVSMRQAVANPGQVIGQLGPLPTLLMWLGSINVFLGIFNLIPGFPLDGGRVLRSILWAIVDDLRRATRWAAWVGQGIGWLMILAGLLRRRDIVKWLQLQSEGGIG